jgi:Ca2+-binding RTX toxin-like protein
MSVVNGAATVDNLVGTAAADTVFAESGNDNVLAGAGDDVVFGGGGNDRLHGEDGNDTIFGASNSAGSVDLDKFQIAEDVTATVTFMGESAGYQNAVGMYRIADDGSISGVDIIFANASLRGSGGSLVAGQSGVDVSLAAGDRLGFFVVPNGYAQRNMAKLLADEGGTFKFVTRDGAPANVDGTGEVYLVHVAPNGRETLISSQYGNSVFHSFTGGSDALNGDGISHAVASVDVASGTVTLGFEDLRGGGDRDFDDSVLRIDIGVTNAALLPRASTGGGMSTDHDAIDGGVGNDSLMGMGGNDMVSGGEGNDVVRGNSGNDAVDGGVGDDVVSGGSGNDSVSGGDGNDELAGNSGDDLLDGGDGNDAISGDSGNDVIRDGDGNDTVDAGSGDDVVIAGAGDDSYDGRSGFDTIDYSGATVGMVVDLSKHIAVGMGEDGLRGFERVIGSAHDDDIKGDKRDNVLVGGDGDDVLRGMAGADTLTGGSGADTFRWLAKDIVEAATGAHLGVDSITDLGNGDVLDLHDLLEGVSYGSLDEVLRITDGANGATVSVRLGGDFVDVVTVAGMTADDLHASGMILA